MNAFTPSRFSAWLMTGCLLMATLLEGPQILMAASESRGASDERAMLRKKAEAKATASRSKTKPAPPPRTPSPTKTVPVAKPKVEPKPAVVSSKPATVASAPVIKERGDPQKADLILFKREEPRKPEPAAEPR